MVEISLNYINFNKCKWIIPASEEKFIRISKQIDKKDCHILLAKDVLKPSDSEMLKIEL